MYVLELYMFSSLSHFNCAFRKAVLQETEAQAYSGLLEVVVSRGQNPIWPLVLLLFCTKIDLRTEQQERLLAWSRVLSPFLKEAEVQSEQDAQEKVMLELLASPRVTPVGLQDMAPSKVTFQFPSPHTKPKSHCICLSLNQPQDQLYYTCEPNQDFFNKKAKAKTKGPCKPILNRTKPTHFLKPLNWSKAW